MITSILRKVYLFFEVVFAALLLFPISCYQRAQPKLTKGDGRRQNRQKRENNGQTGTIRFDWHAAQPLKTVVQGLFPGTRTGNGWDSRRDMPSLEGKVAIVTGGNAGIGLETVRGLLRGGARVYIASRPHQRSAKAIAQLQAELDTQPNTKASVKLLPCDLLDLSSVTRAASDFLRNESQLHMLVCNAGIVSSDGLTSAQGYEAVFATNVLGHHLLVECLVDVMTRTARATKEDTRVCIVSSMAHNLHHPMGFDPSDPQYLGPARIATPLGVSLDIPLVKYGPAYSMLRYAHSKFLNAVQAKVYQRTYGKQGIVFTSVDPGTNLSDIVLRERGFIGNLAWSYLFPLLAFQPSYGAISQLWALTSAEGARLGGQHLIPWARVRPAAGLVNDADMQDAFYAYCEGERAKHGF